MVLAKRFSFDPLLCLYYQPKVPRSILAVKPPYQEGKLSALTHPRQMMGTYLALQG